MKAEQLQELRELAGKATPRPWKVYYENFVSTDSYSVCDCHMNIWDGEASAHNKPNAAYIVAAANAVPDLLDELEEAQAERDKFIALWSDEFDERTTLEQLRHDVEEAQAENAKLQRTNQKLEAELIAMTCDCDDLREALGELTIWWENWMPDEAREQGGYEALEVARQALAGEDE